MPHHCTTPRFCEIGRRAHGSREYLRWRAAELAAAAELANALVAELALTDPDMRPPYVTPRAISGLLIALSAALGDLDDRIGYVLGDEDGEGEQ